MKIEIDISKPSTVRSAISALKRAQTTLLNKVVDEVAFECSEAVKRLAIENIDSAEIGDELILEIQDSWRFSGGNGKYVLTNISDKAHFIEFGVGITGQKDPHPNARRAKYKYDVDGKKLADHSWIFRVGDIDLVDIAEKYVMTRPNGERIYESGRTIRTQGQPAVMYLYNAMISFAESDEPQRIWSEISLKYFG